MPQSTPSHSGEADSAADDNTRASTSVPRTSRPAAARPTALLTKSWTSASVSPSTTSSRITVGANTTTAADASSSRSLPASNTSSASTRASTPIPELSFSPSTPQPSARETLFSAPHDEAQLAGSLDEPKVRAPSRQGSDRSGSHDGEQSSEGAFNDAAEDEPEAVGITASSSIHALDLLHRVNDRAAADRASQSQSLRSRLSQLSVSRASNRYRSRSNSRDASTSARAIPQQFVESQSAESSTSNVAEESLNDVVGEQLEETPNIPASVEPEQYPDRKYYILSSAGKPIYISHASLSRRKRHRDQRRRQQSPLSDPVSTSESNANESDEEDESSTTQVGVMQALISIFADEDSDKLRFIRRGDLLITFLLRAPLYLVCVSNWNEEPSTLRQHLEYLYLQVISLVSASQLSRLFGRMPNFDLRRLLEGTEGIFDYMVNQLNANETEMDEEVGGEGVGMAKRAITDWASCHQWWLQALQPIRITVPNLRDQLTAALQPPTAESGSALQPHRPKDLLYVLLIANGRIVTLLRPRKHSVHPIDLLLLTNTVMGSRSIKRSGGSEEAEIWLPFSMPKFAPQGFVHAYVKFLDPESWVPPSAESSKQGRMTSSELAVIVVTADKDAFPTVSTWISSLIAKPPSEDETASIISTKSKKSSSKSRSKAHKSTSSASGSSVGNAWMTGFQRHILSLCRHLSDPTNVEEGSPRVSAYTCAELGLAGLRHFVYRSNSTIQLTSPMLPEPYSVDAGDRKRLFTLYSLVHHNIHHPVPPVMGGGGLENIAPLSNPTTPAATSSASTGGMLEAAGGSTLASAFGFGTSHPTRPLLNADRRLKMQLVKTDHEQVLGWITAPFELYLCVNPQLSKSAIVAIANGLTKWIKTNERDLFLVNAGSF
ncbi:related to MON1 - required for fusion of cvt-vesicles and autophagosomes with the vacuole [Ustilago trichophora]|uniref:Vacuolar fusion protein MON1 n=1 Tax=Ustilago trichophora TaxID=86804 RepID=A0A5C3E0X7_9BASI|nr:related to MON1 - required for fusion of cvt-vesicles and autophagosomes with the vacuole [Ustilago trichophora]